MKISEQTYKIINKAKEALIENPFDVTHDITHHYRVWENCINIIFEENLLDEINIEHLAIASWWHDYERDSKVHKTLLKVLKENNCLKEDIANVIEIIDSHSFNDAGQFTVESKTLYDADKIEYVSPTRWLFISNEYENNQKYEKNAIKYCDNLNKRLIPVYEKLYFKSSINNYQSNTKNLYKLFTSELFSKRILKGINIKQIKKLIDKF